MHFLTTSKVACEQPLNIGQHLQAESVLPKMFFLRFKIFASLDSKPFSQTHQNKNQSHNSMKAIVMQQGLQILRDEGGDEKIKGLRTSEYLRSMKGLMQ